MTAVRFPPPARPIVHRVRGLAAHVGATVRRERERRRLSQERAAASAGTWQESLSRLERGQVTGMQLETFLRLLDHLQLSIEFIPRDEAVRRYQEEREAAAERQRVRQLELRGTT